MGDVRHERGRAAEDLAVWYLLDKGVHISSRNVRVGRGELDIVGSIGHRAVAFEVRSAGPGRGAVEAFDVRKAFQVANLARAVGIGRVDLIAVEFEVAVVTIRWIPQAAVSF